MFKVLIISYNFPPKGISGVQRIFKFVKYMKQYNWEPTVITSGESGYFAYDDSLLKEIVQDNIRIIRIGKSSVKYRSSILFKSKIPGSLIQQIKRKIGQTFFIPDFKIFWTKKALSSAVSLLEKETFHAIFVTGPPFSLFNISVRLKKKFRIPLIVDYSESWHDSIFSFYPTPIHKAIHKKMEYKVLKSSDAIVTSNRKIKEKLIHRYKFLTFNDINIVTNGFDPADFDGIVPRDKNNNRMRILFSGILLKYNDPGNFLKAFKLLSSEQPDLAKNIEIHFTGYLRRSVQRLIRKLGIQEFIYYHGFITHKDAISKLMSSDVACLIVNKQKRNETTLPGKVFEYFAAGKPVIACVSEGAAKIVINEYTASFICDPDDLNQIKNMIIKVYNLFKENKFPVIDEGELINFRRDYLTEQMTKIFNQSLKVH